MVQRTVIVDENKNLFSVIVKDYKESKDKGAYWRTDEIKKEDDVQRMIVM